MYYSIKMRNYTYISLVISMVLFAIGSFAKLELIIVISWGIAFFNPFIIGNSFVHFVNNSKEFRKKMNYCYSCGFDLREAITASICPKCNSKLNLRDLIDF